MKWLVQDCRELETVGIQGDETEVAGQRSLISWVCARLKSAKIFVEMRSEGMEAWKPPKQKKHGRKMEMCTENVPSRCWERTDRRYGDWKLPFLDRGRSLADLNVSA